MNSANSGTGSGLSHSPASHAWYQPTEPPVASRSSARQSRMSTSAVEARRAPAEQPRRCRRAAGATIEPVCEPRVDPVEHLVEARRDQARQQPRAALEPRARGEERAAPCLTPPPSCRASMNPMPRPRKPAGTEPNAARAGSPAMTDPDLVKPEEPPLPPRRAAARRGFTIDRRKALIVGGGAAGPASR